MYIRDYTGPDYFEQLALGRVDRHSSIYKFGRNDAVGDTEVLIAHGGVYGLPTTAEIVIVTSDDVADVDQGLGAWSIHIFGLDADYKETDEIITMGEASVNEYIRVFRAHVESAGNLNPTGGANIGTITVSQFTSDIDMVLIAPTSGQTLCACFTIPVGYIALMWGADVTVGQGKASVNRLKSREFHVDAPFRTKGIRDAYQNTVGQKFTVPTVFEAKTDIVFTSINGTPSIAVAGTFELELIRV